MGDNEWGKKTRNTLTQFSEVEAAAADPPFLFRSTSTSCCTSLLDRDAAFSIAVRFLAFRAPVSTDGTNLRTSTCKNWVYKNWFCLRRTRELVLARTRVKKMRNSRVSTFQTRCCACLNNNTWIVAEVELSGLISWSTSTVKFYINKADSMYFQERSRTTG